MSSRVLATALVLSLIGSAGTAGAQAVRDTTLRDSTVQRVDQVVVTARVPAAAGGAAAVVVAPGALNVPPAPSLHEILRQVPFVLVRQNSRGEMEVSLRGSESRQVAIMLDGLPLTLGWDHRADPSVIPATGVQSIRLVRGLSSLLHGPNALGGIVEIGLGRSDAAPPPPRELIVGTGIDAYGATVGSIVAATRIPLRAAGSLSVRAGAGYHDRDGIARPKDVADLGADDDMRLNSHYRQLDGFAALRWQGAQGRYVGATMTGYSTERGVSPELHIAEPRFWRYPNQARALGILSAGTGIVATPFGFGSVDLSAGYTRGTLEITAFTDPTYTAVDAREWGDERLYDAHLRLSHSLPFDGQLRAAFTGARVQYGETLDAEPTVHYEQNLWSTGAELEIPVAPRLVLSAGMVNDASTTPESGGREPLGRASRWGWRAGASMLVMGERARLHASVSERSRFPALRELYSGSLNRFAPNPDLQPETLVGTELGISFDALPVAGRTAGLQVVGFHHDLDDAVVRTTLPDSRFLRVNRDRIRTTGAELLGSWNPVGRGVSMSADLLVQRVTVTDGASVDAERKAEHQPGIRGGLELGIPLILRAEGIAAVRYTGAQYCLHPDRGAFMRLGAETVGHATVQRTWQLGNGRGILSALRTVLALDNVTDAAVYDQCGLPQPGRTVRVALQLR